MAKKSAKKATNPPSLSGIVKAIDDVHGKLRTHPATPDQQEQIEATMRFLSGLKETVLSLCLEPREDVLAVPFALARRQGK